MLQYKIYIHWNKIILISFIFPIFICQFGACSLWVHERVFPKYATYKADEIPVISLNARFYLGKNETFKIVNENNTFCIKKLGFDSSAEKMNCELFEQINELKIWKNYLEYSGLIVAHDNSFLIPIKFPKVVFKLPENLSEKKLIEAKLSKDYSYLDLGKKKDSLYSIENPRKEVGLVSFAGWDQINIKNFYDSNSPWEKIEIEKLPKNIFVFSIKSYYGMISFLLIDEKGKIPVEKNFVYIKEIVKSQKGELEYIPLYPLAVAVDIACIPLIPFYYIYTVITVRYFRT